MAVSDWSTTPDSNTNIDGINISEGCAAGNMNSMGRHIMASVRVMYDNLPNTANLITRSGGVFTGNPTFNGMGGYLYHANPSNAGGKITIQPLGGSAPSGPANGDLWGEY